ncbi:putative NTPase (NACHT family) [Rivularia sp. PCC 7116]|uniref:NACHT domain-containing protein n=1 Tax=Rivularia sp. PCC 7116 TaxID=373994 RepID=UPI00029EFA12|nr:NACHT domain-containing protein [Rivularia sp. PCC 7116]AFY53576.1 putative NTPase (NACHT family) [Rivularia sp. PCC 7116]
MNEEESFKIYLQNFIQEFSDDIIKGEFKYYNFSRSFEEKPDFVNPVKHFKNSEATQWSELETIFNYKEQRLLLLGEPGAGKTVLLRMFASKFSQNIDSTNPQSLLPLFAPIRRWDRKEDILNWLINQAKYIYSGINERLLEQKIKAQQVLFLLDGLDELPAKDSSIKDPNAKQRDYRIEFMQKFAVFESIYGCNPTIITCRNRDYQRIITRDGGEKLNLNGAVILKQLNYEEIKNYLEYNFAKDSKFFRKIWSILIQNMALRKMVRTPFLLAVLVSPYISNDRQNKNELEELANINSPEKLFDNFISKSYEREKEKQHNVTAIAFSLKELKQILGQIAVLVMSDEHPDDNYILPDIFNRLLPQEKIEDFLSLCQNLYLLIKSVNTEQETYRFSHLLLREYFAFLYTDQFLNNDLDNDLDEKSITANSHKLIGKDKVAIALGKLNKLRATNLLIDLLRDSDRDVRYEAAKSLGELKAGVYFRGYKQDFSEPYLISKPLSKFENKSVNTSSEVPKPTLKEEENISPSPKHVEQEKNPTSQEDLVQQEVITVKPVIFPSPQEEHTPISPPVVNHENDSPAFKEILKSDNNLLLIPINQKIVFIFAGIFCFLLVLVGFLLGLLVKS